MRLILDGDWRRQATKAGKSVEEIIAPTPPTPPDKGGMTLYTGVVQEGLQTPPTSRLHQYITYHRRDGGALPLGEPP